MSFELSPEVVEKINEAIFAGHKIEAIKLYRGATRTDLRKSKDFIEALELRLRTEDPQGFANRPREASAVPGSVVVLIVVVGLLALAISLLFR